MTKEELKEFLDFKANHYNDPSFFIETDPIQLAHGFSRKEDIEIAGLLASTIAWGNRKAIISSGRNILAIMEGSPFEFIMDYKGFDAKFVHRTFNAEDLDAFFRSLKRIYLNGGLEHTFALHGDHPGTLGRIMRFRETFTKEDFPHRTQKHVANPLKNSSAKRLNMFLRWMVRQDKKGVDFGIWKSVSPSELHLPLDVHTGNVARKLGLLTRAQNDWKSVEEIQLHLVEMDAEDPCKYDFALFGLGAFEGF
jgi:uncharacterized protein (TIGR02757 family)